jgi:hypothetical protein
MSWTQHRKKRDLAPQIRKPTTYLTLLGLRCLPSTLETTRLHDVATQVLLRRRPSIRTEQHIVKTDPRARRRARALHASHDISLQRPAHSINRKVADLEFRSVALPGEARVRVALRDVESLQGVLGHGVAQGDVAEVAQAGAAAVGRRALDYARPGLDVGEVFVVVGGDVADYDVLDDFVLAGELADAAEGDARGAVEAGIFDKNVGAV